MKSEIPLNAAAAESLALRIAAALRNGHISHLDVTRVSATTLVLVAPDNAIGTALRALDLQRAGNTVAGEDSRERF